MTRAVAAVVLLLTVAALQLGDALRGSALAGGPVLVLVSAAAGYLVGASSRWQLALGAVLAAAAALTWPRPPPATAHGSAGALREEAVPGRGTTPVVSPDHDA